MTKSKAGWLKNKMYAWQMQKRAAKLVRVILKTCPVDSGISESCDNCSIGEHCKAVFRAIALMV